MSGDLGLGGNKWIEGCSDGVRRQLHHSRALPGCLIGVVAFQGELKSYLQKVSSYHLSYLRRSSLRGAGEARWPLLLAECWRVATMPHLEPPQSDHPRGVREGEDEDVQGGHKGAPGGGQEESRGGRGVQEQEEGRQCQEGPREPLPRVAADPASRQCLLVTPLLTIKHASSFCVSLLLHKLILVLAGSLSYNSVAPTSRSCASIGVGVGHRLGTQEHLGSPCSCPILPLMSVVLSIQCTEVLCSLSVPCKMSSLTHAL